AHELQPRLVRQEWEGLDGGVDSLARIEAAHVEQAPAPLLWRGRVEVLGMDAELRHAGSLQRGATGERVAARALAAEEVGRGAVEIHASGDAGQALRQGREP